MSVRVLKSGMLSTVQDLGRIGLARLGVGPSGAMDGPALRLANALVGNAAAATALELTLRGPALRFDRACVIALTGANIDARVGDTVLPLWRPLYLPAGSVLRLEGMRHGVRSYLAIAGGLLTQAWLGSASVDVNAGIGSSLQVGAVLDIGSAVLPGWVKSSELLCWPTWSLASAHWFDTRACPIRAVPGPHFEMLEQSAQAALFNASFRIGQDSNRVGFRLQGITLEWSKPLELVSEAVDFGSVQLPPAGEPIVLMAEHPTTGGYPRIAQIAAVDLPYLAQQRPGASVRLERIGGELAESLLIERERALLELIAEISRRLHCAR